MGGAADIHLVPMFTLDRLLDYFPAPDIIKIDVEGAEVEVLQGGSRMIEDIRPIIICEVARSTRDVITSILHAAGYILYTGLKPKSQWTPLDLASWNTIAFPRN